MRVLFRLLVWVVVATTAGAAVDVPNRIEKITHLAFVVDTSGAMRNPRTRALWPAAVATLEEMLGAHPKLKFVQLVDCDGRPLLGSRDQWLPLERNSVEDMKRALGRSRADGKSDPMPGLAHALTLPLPEGMDDRTHVCVIGAEFTGTPRLALRQLERENPDDGTGRRRAVISAVQVPASRAADNHFEELFGEAAKRSGGTFTVLPGTN